MSETVAFDEKGLVPCVAQDWSTGEVLTLAYMNAEALRLTVESVWSEVARVEHALPRQDFENVIDDSANL